MPSRAALVLVPLALALLGPPAAAQPRAALEVVRAGPTGEVASLEEANEIRVIFSEPMVALGRIPQPVKAPFFSMTPAVDGSFRWSGTTILVFTPGPKTRLPRATRFTVTIDETATALSGRRLARPYRFTFTTPTVRLLALDWYRRGGRYDRPVVVLLRFNQRVSAADVAKHLALAYRPHPWSVPTLTGGARSRLQAIDPQATASFDAKVKTASAAAAASGPVAFALATDWDKKTFPPAPDLVVVETVATPPPESWLRVSLDGALPAVEGSETPEAVQDRVLELEPTFFVNGLHCVSRCDPAAGNPVLMRGAVPVDRFRAAVSAVDVTDPARERPVQAAAAPRPRPDWEPDESNALTLEDAGFDRQPPASTYAVTIDAGLQASDGQTLGHRWIGLVENWHERAFTSFGDGHGVWETGGGATLPFHSRNFADVTQWAAPVAPAELLPKLLELEAGRFRAVPPGPGRHRALRVTPDKIESQGLDLSAALGPGGRGLVWAGVQEGTPIPRSQLLRSTSEPPTRSTLVQVTNLGITVKDSPHSVLVFVTRLDTGDPVGGAVVSIVEPDKGVFWKGVTDAQGVALGPGVPLRDPRRWWDTSKTSFIVVAEKDGDLAYVGNTWHEGVMPWDFGQRFDLTEATDVLRGTVFTDRGVYRLGEEVHAKAVLRADTPSGIRLLPPATPIHVSVRDGQDREVHRRTVTLGEWSSGEWTMALPAEGSLGTYTIHASLDDEATREARRRAARREGEGGEGYDPFEWRRAVTGAFLVAAYRRPDFRVDVALAGESPIAGAALRGVVKARYLFGAPMGNRPVKWTLRRSPVFSAPREVTDRYSDERYAFVGWREIAGDDGRPLAGDDAKLGAQGELALELATRLDAGLPYLYTLEGDVEDVSRQRIANRASTLVHPAPWYIGLKRPPYFVEQKAGLETAVVAVTPGGRATAGVAVTVSLTQVQWHSVRRAEGQGFYAWETERREVDAGTWTVTTAEAEVPLTIPLPQGGYFVLKASASDGEGRVTATETSFYALGPGYTAWARYDHNRIDLVPERSRYKPGDTARIMIQSPWERATALVTTEREGIRSHRRFALTSTQQTIEIPVDEGDIPNLYVSVLLVKGRTKAGGEDDGSDPGKPSFRLGYTELRVEDASKRLAVAVRANQEEYRPAGSAKVDLEVKDALGRPAASEVTLWAVDYGVLSLTGFRTPDVLGSVYVPKALQVTTTDNRQRIVSRRVLVPKGADEGGGGGADPGAGTLRRDFRVLAFWVGSVTTDASGRASVDVTLPESLTTYRIMAVGGDKASRFGSGESEIRVNKPVTLRPAFPRFLALGDRAVFGAVVTSQLREAGTAVVTMRSLDPGVMTVGPEARQSVTIAPGGAAEVRFEAIGRAVGRARVEVRVALGAESDAFEDVVPVEVLVSPETVAAYGQTATEASERLVVPTGVVPGFGGLHLELSSTAMVGLGEGARFLVEYPYGCAEQRGSRSLALLLAADLGEAFRLPGLAPDHLKASVQASLRELEKFQCPSGGFGYWVGDCSSPSPYLTSYLLHVFRVASSMGYATSREMRERAYGFLERKLDEPPPVNEGWWPAYTAWQAFAVKVLYEGGRPRDSNLNRLYGYLDRMPVFALAHLHDALAAKGETGGRAAELRRRLLNAVLPEGGSAHVEELSDPYLLWFWNSNVRSTAIVLGSLVRGGGADADLARSLVRWLMAARRQGRWGNTQENAWALEALVGYYRAYEREAPSYTGVVTLDRRELARARFEGRSTAAATREVPLAELVGQAAPGTARDLAFRKEGAGTLFYVARLRYAVDELHQQGLDNGITVQRVHAPAGDTGASPPATAFKAGDLVRVTITLDLTKERRFVAVTDPLPAGFEAVETAFQTTAAELVRRQQRENEASWEHWWQRGGFDHVERYDDRVVLFATRLAEGRHEFSYLARATTAGSFRVAPARAEEMYEPEVFGRTATAVIEVAR